MRLKRRICPTIASNWSAMNQKNLNYEIETEEILMPSMNSITAMNQKNLNYEIETSMADNAQISKVAMNQKNLNYEIETQRYCWQAHYRSVCYESKESQL